MRLLNFLSPASNRAALSITQTLYDRRALDCTSSRPLVQSLQQLMILTGSSSRVRETLCNDGGLERIVQIMKEIGDHGDDQLASYKWHLCMQCLLNLGARGSENVRMRILEAGAIPVIVTILDNYLVAHGDSLEHRDRDGRGAQSIGSSSSATGLGLSAFNPADPNSAGNSVHGYRGARYNGSNPRVANGSIQTRSTTAPSLETNTSLGLGVIPNARERLDRLDRETPLFDPDQNELAERTNSRLEDARLDARIADARNTDARNDARNMDTRIGDARMGNGGLRTGEEFPNNNTNINPAATARASPEVGRGTTRGTSGEPSTASVTDSEVSDVSSQPPLEAITNLQSFFATRGVNRAEPFPELMPPTVQLNQLNTRSNAEVNQSGMAQFVDGLLVPKEQDVFWALEIIAFVSKYSHLRREMQDTHFLPKLSLRPAEEAYSLPESTESEDYMDAEQGPLGMGECHGHDTHQHHHHHQHQHQHQHHHQHEDEDSDGSHCPQDAREISPHGSPPQYHDHNHDYIHGHDGSAYAGAYSNDYAQREHYGSIDGDPPPSLQGRSSIDSQGSSMNVMDVEADGKQQTAKFSEPNARAYYTYDFENKFDFEDEFLARSVNLFEIVEQFTAFRSPREFPHWACIIMRNFVRKDEGGIRQCANFACGKWEEYPRQFAKCRRCKRTKYCSKACQLKAWSMHRYWCSPSSSTSQYSSQSQQSAQTQSSQAAQQQHAGGGNGHAAAQPTTADAASLAMRRRSLSAQQNSTQNAVTQ